MKLNGRALLDPAQRRDWASAGVSLPSYDVAAMSRQTAENPTWLHFGAGNIFRSFIARLNHSLLDRGLADSGIIAVETFDYEIIDRIYDPFDNLALSAGMAADGSLELDMVASVAEAIRADKGTERLAEIFRSPSLQMVSFTITEKGYALTDMKGHVTAAAREDMASSPENAKGVMALAARLLWERFRSGGRPVAMVSMDNCSHNGEKLRGAALEIADAWRKSGFVSDDFISWLTDENRVSFPWSMIDKITPRPSKTVYDALTGRGAEDMDAVVTSRGTHIAPFANAEIPQYLVIEDRFPAGRPKLENAGVYLTDRETVNRAETMKVCTCLNPLHTALAVYGCLLGYDGIAAEMSVPILRGLAERIGYKEGLPVVVDPGIFSPRDFLREVLEERLPNPYIPDTPQRIATDTSQKIVIRYGETIKAYMTRPDLDASGLTAIPLVIAAWFRYLLGADDDLLPMEISGDPLLPELQKGLEGIDPGSPDSYRGQLKPFLSNTGLFAVDLFEAGLGERIENLFVKMLAGKGAVRRTLADTLGSAGARP
ncbi:MAG: mannitol dehydrogenase family protein [Synergistaceae bacterium]|jgi:fructuronate reductase|nr:mannitol dehydrogenase family protein [Synergistaceae bacterium]